MWGWFEDVGSRAQDADVALLAWTILPTTWRLHWMNAAEIPADLRTIDAFQHIDMGFLNRRLCLTALGDQGRAIFAEHKVEGNDHHACLANDHLLVTILEDICEHVGAPTLLE